MHSDITTNTAQAADQYYLILDNPSSNLNDLPIPSFLASLEYVHPLVRVFFAYEEVAGLSREDRLEKRATLLEKALKRQDMDRYPYDEYALIPASPYVLDMAHFYERFFYTTNSSKAANVSALKPKPFIIQAVLALKIDEHNVTTKLQSINRSFLALASFGLPINQSLIDGVKKNNPDLLKLYLQITQITPTIASSNPGIQYNSVKIEYEPLFPRESQTLPHMVTYAENLKKEFLSTRQFGTAEQALDTINTQIQLLCTLINVALRTQDTKEGHTQDSSYGFEQWIPLVSWYFDNNTMDSVTDVGEAAGEEETKSDAEQTQDDQQSHDSLTILLEGLAHLDAFCNAEASAFNKPSKRQCILNSSIIIKDHSLSYGRQNHDFVDQAFLLLFDQFKGIKNISTIMMLGKKWDAIQIARQSAKRKLPSTEATLMQIIINTPMYKAYQQTIADNAAAADAVAAAAELKYNMVTEALQDGVTCTSAEEMDIITEGQRLKMKDPEYAKAHDWVTLVIAEQKKADEEETTAAPGGAAARPVIAAPSQAAPAVMRMTIVANGEQDNGDHLDTPFSAIAAQIAAHDAL